MAHHAPSSTNEPAARLLQARAVDPELLPPALRLLFGYGNVQIDTSLRVPQNRGMRTKRTYNLPERTVLAVRDLAATYGVASTQDGVIELAVDELSRRLREDEEGQLWDEAAASPAFRAEAADLAQAYRTADRETWPPE